MATVKQQGHANRRAITALLRILQLTLQSAAVDIAQAVAAAVAAQRPQNVSHSAKRPQNA